MSELIHLKQRIKAIGAIRKITQTMRLISMSSHSKLKKQTEALQRFRGEIKPLLCALTSDIQLQQSETLPKYKTLYIICAAEKGLCGTFNTSMFTYFNQQLPDHALENCHIISIGKKATQYLEGRGIKPLFEFDKALPNQLEKIAQSLYEKIIQIQNDYQSVVCMYSYPKTFFIQEAQSLTLMPITQDPCEVRSDNALQDYEWIQDKQSVIHSMFQVLLKTNILLVLSNSMLSEQSARFLSMDNATRSAETLLKEMKLTFNKMRQAKITRELIELISSF